MAKKSSLKAALLTHQTKAAAKQRVEDGQKKSYANSKRTKLNSSSTEKAVVREDTVVKVDVKGKQKQRDHIPFQAGDRILLVGEGNFSFALSLVTSPKIPVSPALLVTTSYDSEAECFEKYPEAEEIVDKLRAMETTVLFSVDARALEKRKELRGLVFDKLVFNFPHAGAGIADQDRNILTNQHLLLAFFQSAASFLSAGSDPSPVAEDRKKISRSKKRKRQGADADDDRDEDADEPVSDLEEEVPQDYEEDEDVEKPAPTMNTSGTKEFRKSGLERLSRNALGNNGRRGSIFITLRDAKPYSLWDVPRLAKRPAPLPPPFRRDERQPRYSLVRSTVFDPAMYVGYEHRRTIGGATGVGPNEDITRAGGCRTWEFVLRDSEED